MAKGNSGPWAVIEWSPGLIRVYDPDTRQTSTVSPDNVGTVLGSRPAIVAISRRAAFVRTTRLPDAAKADVARILQLQIDTLFPIGSADAAIDFLQTADRSAEGRLAIVAATPSETLARAKAELRSVNIERIVPAALGAIPLAAALGQDSIAIVQDSPEGLSIDLVEDGLLKASRVVPQPSSAAEIAAEVQRSWAMSKGEGPIAAAGGLVFDGADYSTPMSSLAALSIDPPDLNLEDPAVLAQREAKKLQKVKMIAAMTWCLALLFAILIFNDRAAAAKIVNADSQKWTAKSKSLKDAVTMANDRTKQHSDQSTVLVGAFEPKQYIGDVATIFSSMTPQGLWLTGITLERGKTASIRGTAMTHKAVSDYLETLGSMERFRDIKLGSMVDSEIEGTAIVNFTISMHVIGNFPLTEDMKGTTKNAGAKK